MFPLEVFECSSEFKCGFESGHEFEVKVELESVKFVELVQFDSKIEGA